MWGSNTFTLFTLFLFSTLHPVLWVLLAVLGVTLVGWSLAVVDGQRQRRLTRLSHELLVKAWSPAVMPAVDVFLPTAGERVEILRNTFSYVHKLEWDGPLTVWVLDDAASPAVAALAAEFGFEYRTRPDRGHLKKAGNLNFGYAQSRGDLIVVFDADFCPRSDFLYHLAPYFAEENIGIVQSPQCFDTGPEQTWVERASAATQEVFFRWLQPSRDADDAAICCGTNAVYRRTALDAIGGFPKLDHSEDLFTGLEMRKVGFRMQYVPVLIAKGISPSALGPFVNQQYRWCMGNLQVMVDPTFYRTRLPWRARVAFISGFINYVGTAANVFAVPIPILTMLLLYPQDVRPWHLLPFLPPVWICTVLLPAILHSHWRLEVVRLQTLQGLAYAVAVAHLIKRRQAAWVPTGAAAAKTPLARKVSWLAVAWLSSTLAAAWVGFVHAGLVAGWQTVWTTAFFSVGYSHLALPLIRDAWRTLYPRRRHPRRRHRAAHREQRSGRAASVELA